MARIKLKNVDTGKWEELPLIQGEKGDTGTSIAKVEQTTTSTESSGSNVITVTMSDNTSSTFTVKNGAKGDKGDPGSLEDNSVTTAKLADNSVTTAKVADGSITNAKLANEPMTLIFDSSKDGDTTPDLDPSRTYKIAIMAHVKQKATGGNVWLTHSGKGNGTSNKGYFNALMCVSSRSPRVDFVNLGGDGGSVNLVFPYAGPSDMVATADVQPYVIIDNFRIAPGTAGYVQGDVTVTGSGMDYYVAGKVEWSSNGVLLPAGKFTIVNAGADSAEIKSVKIWRYPE